MDEAQPTAVQVLHVSTLAWMDRRIRAAIKNPREQKAQVDASRIGGS